MPIWRDIVPIFYLKYWAFAWKITEFVEDDECLQRREKRKNVNSTKKVIEPGDKGKCLKQIMWIIRGKRHNARTTEIN